jgi:hypothetical protein
MHVVLPREGRANREEEGHHCAPLLDVSADGATRRTSQGYNKPWPSHKLPPRHGAAPLDISMMWPASETGNFVDLTRTNQGAGGAGPSHAMKGEDKEEEQWANHDYT